MYILLLYRVSIKFYTGIGSGKYNGMIISGVGIGLSIILLIVLLFLLVGGAAGLYGYIYCWGVRGSPDSPHRFPLLFLPVWVIQAMRPCDKYYQPIKSRVSLIIL